MKRIVLVLLAVLAVACWLPGQAAHADTAISLTSGYLTTATGNNFGIAATGAWAGASPAGFKIEWEVTAITGGFHYEYDISDAGGGGLNKDLSHIILQISNDAVLADFSNFSTPYTTGDPTPYSTSGSSGSNPNMPNPIYGFKFTPTTDPEKALFTIEFDSTRAPTWGNFYAKDGNAGPVTAWNLGLADPSSTNAYAFISVPDTKTVVPLPGALLLLGGGLVRLAAYSRRKRQFAA